MKRLIAIGAHCDDIDIMYGGTFAKFELFYNTMKDFRENFKADESKKIFMKKAVELGL